MGNFLNLTGYVGFNVSLMTQLLYNIEVLSH